LPAAPQTYFLHDVVVAEAVRGVGAARAVLSILQCVARLHRLDSITLVSVNATTDYWTKLGFRAVDSLALQSYVREKYSNEAVLMSASVSLYFET
jgi:N-acetylglutamate synthase-like GNAT family acetyltransferase